MFNIPWATSNKGILTKRNILFVCVRESQVYLNFGIHVCYLPGGSQVCMAKHFDRGLGNIALFSSPGSQSFATLTDTKQVK